MDTETLAATNLFYAVTALSDSTAENSKSTLNAQIAISDGETKSFSTDQRVIFDAKVRAGGTIRGGIKAFNQNLPQDWPGWTRTTERATRAVAALASTDGARPAAILKAALEVYRRELARLDQDTPLGEIALNIPAEGPAEEIKEWKMSEKRTGNNTWDYKVRYRIVRSK